jgi:small subunit ribosomal protein S16
MGAKKRPTYRFVATDSRMPRDGRFIEILGHYNPTEKPATVNVNEEKVFYWLKQGAVPSDTAKGLFKQIGLLRKWEMVQKGEDVSQIVLATQLKERTKKKKKRAKKAEAGPPAAEGVAKETEKKQAKSESGSIGPEEAAPSAKAEEPKEEKKKPGES